jgi:hypothetical protein
MDLAFGEEPRGTGTVYDIPDEKLIERAVRNARPLRRAPRWSAISDQFSLGCTYSKQLCRRFDLEPDEILAPRKS